MSLIKLTHESINPYKLISDYEKANCDAKTIGGESIFIGYMMYRFVSISMLSHRLLYFLWIMHSFQKFQKTIFLKIFEIPSIG